MKKALDLGFGGNARTDKEYEYVNLDILNFKGTDVVRDIEKGLPFADKTFDKVFCHHVLEHVDDLVFVMNEIWRVLRFKGELEIRVPAGSNAYIDPSHKRFFPYAECFNFFIVKDFNSGTAGVRGWFGVKSIVLQGPSREDIRGWQYNLFKVKDDDIQKVDVKIGFEVL